MRRFIPTVFLLALVVQPQGAEIQFDFNRYAVNEAPAEFRSLLSGQGKPGEWSVILDETAPPQSSAQPSSGRHVLAQRSIDPTDERFPMFLYDRESFGDFKLTTRFKIVAGQAEQMAGIAFRVRDEKNYYYVRASSLGNTFRFFKIVDGQRSSPIGPEVAIPRGQWHELAVECKGNQIRCSLNGKELIPPLTDNSFSAGKIAFWTKSDSISYFADTRITYTPRETLARALIRETLEKFPRLAGLKIIAGMDGLRTPSIIASDSPKDIGTPATEPEKDVIAKGAVYFGRGKETVTVTLPLHDRNGESVAAVRVTMKSFIGQTEQNAVARALPMVKQMEGRIRNAADLFE